MHAPTKSNLGYQNKHRSWELFRDYYYALSKHLGQQAGFKQVKFRIKSKIFLLDASTISLCLSLFDWAKYKWYLSNLVAFLRINLFVKIELQKWLDEPFLKKEKPPDIAVQGVLFNF